MIQYGVVLFHTTSAVMRAEKLLIKEGYSIKLIPPPRQFSSDCGISVRFNWTDREKLEALLSNTGIEFDSIYFLSMTK